MNVRFECKGRSPFIIEVGYWDTVLEIKEKVQKYQGIPVDRQTLILNDKVLPENGNVGYCQIHNLSTIKLVITPPGNVIPGARTDVRIVEPEIATPDVSVVDPLVRPEILPPDISMPEMGIEEQSMSEILVNVRFGTADESYAVMMDPSDTVRSLKEVFQELAEISVPVENLMMRLNANVLQDHLSLFDSQVLNRSEVVASINKSARPSSSSMPPPPRPSSSSMPPPPPVLRPPMAPPHPRAPVRASAPGTRINKLILRVQQMYTIHKIMIRVEVNAFDNVEELRKKLEKMQEDRVLALPPEGYFFIRERIVMHEDKTFRWHSVRSGDLIEIWAGAITGGTHS